MKKSFKISIYLSVSLVVIAVAAYLAWNAWDNGLIGHNPRAPIASAMEDAVRRQATIDLFTKESSTPCIRLDFNRPAPEISGFTGIAPAAVPGRFSITLFRQTNARDQALRDIQLGQLDHLTSHGFFTATDSNVETDSGSFSARNYQLTWKGYSDNQISYGNSLCLNYGQREYTGIEKIEKTLESIMGLEVYEVTYTSKRTNQPAWLQSAEAQRWFPEIQRLTEDSKGRIKLLRTKDGWRSAHELELEAAIAAKGQGNANMYFLEMQKNLVRQPPSIEETTQLIAGQSTDPNWLARTAVACLPIQLQRGGDDRPLPGSNRTDLTTTPFSVIYFDKPDRKEYELRMMYKTLHVLSALEHAGLARMERILPPRPSKKRAVVNSLPSPDAQYGGIRFTLLPEAADALGLVNQGGGCIPAGRITTELLSIQGNRGAYQIKARGLISQTPDWAVMISEHLPALKSLLDNGIQLSGQLSFNNFQGEAKWRLNGLQPNYPEINYDTIPQHLAVLMPRTVAAFPSKQLKAPALVQPAPTAAVYSAPQPVANTALQTPSPSVPTKPSLPASPTVPYPADGSPVHVVSIYQAFFPQDKPRRFQEHPEGIVNIKVSADQAILLLLAYEPVEWHIEADRGTKLKRIIALGNYEPRITYSGAGKPQVTTARRADMLSRIGTNLETGFITRNESNDRIDIATITRTITGTLPKTFQVSYEAPASGFSISPQTAVFSLPTPQKPDGSRITLNSAFKEEVQGNRLFRGSAGAYTDAWSDRAYSAGKLYYEGTMKVTGSLTAHTHANIGLCLERGIGIESSTSSSATVISHGSQKLYKDGDVFGIAVDFDQNRLYFRVNGKWLSGTPESGNGLKLQAGKQYRACVFAAGTVTGEVARGIPQSDTAWDVNFGEKAFHSPLPSGYIPFDGNSKK